MATLTLDQLQAAVQAQLAHHLGPYQAEIQALQAENQAIRAELSRALASGSGHRREEFDSLPRAFKAPNLDTYSGDKKENLHAWLFQVERQFKLLSITDDEQKVIIAGLALRKAAQTWYQSTYGEESKHSAATWEEFKTNLQAFFNPVSPVEIARDEIAELRQETSVREYTSHFLQLAVYCHP